MTNIPPLRPLSRGSEYYIELREFAAQHGDALRSEVEALKAERKTTLRYFIPLALRYRLKLAALFVLMEDYNLVAAGTYNRLKDSRITYADGTTKAFAPMRLLAEHIVAHGLPDAAPGCEEPTP